MPSVSVLVVEDFAPFQQFISSALKKSPNLQVIGVVSDGLEAVQKAEELQPELILLDIGLPTLDGIEAAPESKLLFLSQESSADVVQEVLHSGALGYVAKRRAGIDLLAAVEAICQGMRFVSPGLLGDVPVGLGDRQASNCLQPYFASQPETGD